MSLQNRTRRSTQAQTLQKLLSKYPGVEKTFQYVHTQREGDTKYPLSAKYPILTRESKRLTMAAYQLYVVGYNRKVRQKRSQIRKHNAALDREITKNPPPNWRKKQCHFAASHGNLLVWDYNKKAHEHNERFGAIIPLRLPQTIKQTTEKVFSTFLWAYGDQLLKLKRSKEANNIAYDREVNKMEVNTKHMENTKGDLGMFMLDYCPDTILNHKNRLIEAGILINNEFRSSKRGTMHHICPEILVVFDDFRQKPVCAVNQLVRIARPEVFRDVFIPTGSINKPKVKGVDNSTLGRKKVAKGKDEPAANGADFLGDISPSETTGAPRIKQNFPQNGKSGTENEKKITEKGPIRSERAKKIPPQAEKRASGSTTEYLRSLFCLINVLAKQLFEKEHEKIAPVPLDILEYEAKNGTMDRPEFREWLIHELFKQFSKIYVGHPHLNNIFAGEWYRALKIWHLGPIMRNREGEVLEKDRALHQYRQLLFAFSDKSFGAYHVARRTKFVPARPSIYLDTQLNSPGTFGYHLKSVAKNVRTKMEAEAELLRAQRKNASQNSLYSQNLRKLNRNIARWYDRNLDYRTLYDYSANNMPEIVHQDLPKHVENFLLNRNQEMKIV